MRTVRVFAFGVVAVTALAACGFGYKPATMATVYTYSTVEHRARKKAPASPQPVTVNASLLTSSLPQETASLEDWSTRYPDAAWELISWSNRNKEAALALIAWDQKNPEALRVLVLWAITHRYETSGAFLYDRCRWGEFAAIAQDNPEALDGFLSWVRRSSPAARELVTHPAALSWLVAGRY